MQSQHAEGQPRCLRGGTAGASRHADHLIEGAFRARAPNVHSDVEAHSDASLCGPCPSHLTSRNTRRDRLGKRPATRAAEEIDRVASRADESGVPSDGKHSALEKDISTLLSTYPGVWLRHVR